MADDTSEHVESRGEVLPAAASDEAEDLYNSGVTTRIVERVGAYGTTTLKCRSVGPSHMAVKVLVGVTEHTCAVRAINTVAISDESKEKGARAHGVDTDGMDHDERDPLGVRVTATGNEGKGTLRSACEKRDATVLPFTKG